MGNITVNSSSGPVNFKIAGEEPTLQESLKIKRKVIEN